MADQVISNHFSAIANALESFFTDAVSDTAKEVVSEYQMTGAVDTGFMVSSAYIVTPTEDTYGQGMAPTRKDSYLLPEVDPPTDKTTAYAAVGANYAVYVELGTRRMSAQPAFYPAVEGAASFFQQELGGLEDYLKQAIGL